MQAPAPIAAKAAPQSLWSSLKLPNDEIGQTLR